MTIAEAAVKVLQQTKTPMNAREIHEAIVKSGLYQFKAKNPAAVVSSALKSRSSGANMLFVRMEDGKFRLV